MKRIKCRVKETRPIYIDNDLAKDICRQAHSVDFLFGYQMSGYFDVSLVWFEDDKFLVARDNGKIIFCKQL